MALAVLPDENLSPGLIERVHRFFGPVLRRHPSGRPWIAGDPGDRRLVHARNDSLEVVLVGSPTAGEQVLAARTRNARDVAELDGVAADLVGSDVLLFARQDGRMRAQAPAFLTASLFWARVDGVAVVSDEQRPLALLAGAGVDLAVLAGRLTGADLSHPFSLNPIWAGVRGVGPGEWLSSVGGAPPRRRKWWTAPPADRSAADLAPRLNARLRDYLADRVAGHRAVSADLSGGLDSTSLCFFLAETGKPLHTVFFSSSNALNNDHAWSARAAGEIGSRHVVRPYAVTTSSLTEGDAVSVARLPEGPSLSSSAIASVAVLDDLLAGTGSTLHVNGHGGDALFGPVSTMPWSLVRSTDPRRFAKVWRHRAVNRYPLRPALRMLLRGNSYRSDLARVARSRFDRPDTGVAHHSRWLTLPTVNPVLTGRVGDLLRGLATRALDERADALAPDRLAHQVAHFLTVHGAAVRQMNLARGGRGGIRYDSPYLDRRVVDLALSLTISERAHQLPAKPLLAAARPARMSLEYFTRRDKGDYTAEVFDKHRALAGWLRGLFDGGSVLEELGIVSAPALLRAVGAYSVDGSDYAELAHIGFAEKWLRSVRDAEGDPPGGREEVGSAQHQIRG